MYEILALLQCLLPQIKVTTMRQMNQIIIAMLAMSGRVTMLVGLCRKVRKNRDTIQSPR
ncbi:MAG: hypothetical protein CLLPBCKN_007396 [Chroococcidiopsis cubana SAG 39.79]|nr:hypothetical protein [Chroococcidiopsis cubana SAG 39.79]